MKVSFVFFQHQWQNTDSSAWAAHKAPLEWKLLQGQIHSIKAWPWHPWRTSKDSQVASTPSVSSDLLSCTIARFSVIVCLCFLCNCALSVALKDASACVLNTKKQTTLLFCFYEAVQLKYMHALCVHVTLHLINASVGELEHLPCMQPSYIHNSRSQLLSIWMSLSCILLIWSHSNLILSHGLFPVATHKPKLSTVGLK